MSIPNTRPLERRPVHPGEILREEFLPAYGLTVRGLAEAIGVSRQSINELLRERRAVTAEMALRLAQHLGTVPEYWLNLQRAVDLYDARLALAPKSAGRAEGAVVAKGTSASVAALAAQVMRDPRASKIQKSLATSALSQQAASRETLAEAERMAAKVLRGKQYAGVTRKLAASVIARARSE